MRKGTYKYHLYDLFDRVMDGVYAYIHFEVDEKRLEEAGEPNTENVFVLRVSFLDGDFNYLTKSKYDVEGIRLQVGEIFVDEYLEFLADDEEGFSWE